MFPPSSPYAERVRIDHETRELNRRAENRGWTEHRYPWNDIELPSLPKIDLSAFFALVIRRRPVHSDC